MLHTIILEAREIREENRRRYEANRAQIAECLQAENDYWIKVLREEPARREEALDELDRIRVLGRAS